ncbi:hypothetical protein [Streptomyces sp. RKCA744]|uniref:hypothetical protein n=1 Tax=Streptomyces sp. RKCA744 TaxID=2959340 RepID=UPI00209CC347|nr:hypothetical protein [Streptomyces sp. RKCA744]
MAAHLHSATSGGVHLGANGAGVGASGRAAERALDGTGSGAGERRRTGRVAHHQGPVEQPAGA